MANLPINEQFRIMARLWGTDPGYVFLAWIPGHLKTREERTRRGVWKERAFAWPVEKAEILDCLKDHDGDDLYFCPNMFERPQRKSNNLPLMGNILYADLDEADPRGIEDNYKPTIAWRTSTGRYQAAWILDRFDRGTLDDGGMNQRLSIYVDADPTGWDCTQLLRVPGRKNWKPGKGGEQGKVLWTRGNYYSSIDDFDDLPEVEVIEIENSDIDEKLLDSIDRSEVWARVRKRVSPKVREYMSINDEEDAELAALHHKSGEGHSGLIWHVERELADAGCSMPEIVALVRPMHWNKFKGRANEMTQLIREASKVVAITNKKLAGETVPPSVEKGDADLEGVEDDGGALEIIEPVSLDPVSMDDFLNTPKPHPSWLVKDIWARGTVGFIAGAPKSYKSWMGLDLAISVATGSKFLGVYEVPRKGRVLYVQEEDSDVEVDDRMRKIYHGKEKELHPHGYLTIDEGSVIWHPREVETLLWMSVRKGLDLTDAAWQTAIADACEEGDYDLVIIDTLGTTIGDADTDKAREVNSALRPLKKIATDYGCAIAVVHHFSKQGSDKNNESRGGRKMLGSVAIHAWAECGIYVGEKTEVRPGVWQVPVERETKRARDARFRLEVPTMGVQVENEEGVMMGNMGWSPTILPGKGGTIEEDSGFDPNAKEPRKSFVGKGVHPRNGKPAGASIAMKLVGAAAVKESLALTPPQIRERLFSGDTSPQSIHQQLKKAVENNFVAKTDDGRYYALKSVS